MRLAIAALILVSCSSNSDPSAPMMCDPASEQVGAYLWQYTEVSGDCGSIPSQVIVWPNPVSGDNAGGRTCTTMANQLSDGNCKDEFVYSCTYLDGETWSYTRVLTQQTQDGSMLSGILTERASGPDANCVETYDVTMTRQ
jgi:hypothetical protein